MASRTKVVYGPGGRKRFFIDGDEVSPEEYARTVHPWKIKDLLAKSAVVGGLQPSGWPVLSEGMAVGLRQIDEAEARNKRAGCSVKYCRKTGRAILHDAAQKKQLMRIEGMFDKDAFS